MMGQAKRGGRPPLKDGEQSTTINIRVPNSVYDETCRKAAQDRVSVPEVVRRALENLLHGEEDDD